MSEITSEDNRLSNFLDNTTLHGVRYFKEKSYFRKVVWFLFVGAAMALCSIQIYETCDEYWQWPFSTTITREKVHDLDFPAITICNLNTISRRQLLEKNINAFANISDYERNQELQKISAMIRSNIRQADNTTTSQFLNRENGSDLMVDAITNYSHNIEDMLGHDWLNSCIWRGASCSAKNFTSFVNLKMGHCFTFNSGKSGHEILKSYIPGPNNGLKLRLNIEEEDHLSDLNSLISGFKVSIQHQDNYPLVEEFGFALQPGTHTFAAIRPKKIINLPTPYRTNCSSPELPLAKYHNYNHSVDLCMLQCFHDYVTEKCGCQPLFNAIAGKEVCSIMETVKCIFPKMHGRLPFEVSECTNQCPEPCEYTKYDAKLSYALTVSNAFTRSVILDLTKRLNISKIPEFLSMTVKERQEFVRNNVLSLDVYFEEMGYDLIEQKPAMSFTSLFGTIGGYLGLLLGMSVITVLEFVDYILIWIIKVCRINTGKHAITA